MRERRIGLAVIVALLLALGWHQGPRIHVSAVTAPRAGEIEVRAAVDLGAQAGALLFTWTIEHLTDAR